MKRLTALLLSLLLLILASCSGSTAPAETPEAQTAAEGNTENVPSDGAENSTETKRVLNLRLQETHGKRTTVTLEFFRKAQSACLNDFCGEKIRSLDVDAGRPLVNLQPYAWEEVQIEFV